MKNWVFSVDIDDPIPTTQNKSSKGCEPSSEQVGMLTEMGFTPAQARKALRETVRKKILNVHIRIITILNSSMSIRMEMLKEL